MADEEKKKQIEQQHDQITNFLKQGEQQPTQSGPALVDGVQKINPRGQFVFEFAEGTDDETRQKFDQMIETAKKEGRNIYLEPGRVRAREMNSIGGPSVTAQPPKQEPPKEEPKKEELKQEPPVQQQAPPQPQQPAHVMQQDQPLVSQRFQQGNPSNMQLYDAWGNPVNVVPQAPPQYQNYHPGASPQYGYVQNPQQAPPPMFQNQVYNPNLAVGPIGQKSAPLPQQQQVPQQSQASVRHPSEYTQHFTQPREDNQ